MIPTMAVTNCDAGFSREISSFTKRRSASNGTCSRRARLLQSVLLKAMNKADEAKKTARRLQDLEKRRAAQPGVAAEGAAGRR